ncbi:MAG: RNA polymerase sigma factor [Myxococcota bacterium]
MRKDAELLQAWKDGDNAAGNELFDRHFDSLRRFFRNKVDITEVEDLMQRTLLACLEVVPKFRGEASFRTYLFVIARRQLVDYIRRKTRKENREAPDLGVSSIADFGITPSRAAFEQEVQALLAQAMQSIPVDFQITLEMYYWEQLKGPELAEVLGISPTTVRTRLHRAREALRKQLAQLHPSVAEADDDTLAARLAELASYR